MANISVNLQPLISNLNLPTVIKTAILPNEGQERLFVATQLGEIFYLGDGLVELFLDISDRVIELGRQTGGYDERGLLGLAFHPDFQYNGLFYIHYSLAGSQGPGALEGSYRPNPCNLASQSLTWDDRENRYDHIDTVEEWVFENNGGPPSKRRTLLNLRRPFMKHNGVNSLHFSPETGKLILTIGDGGS
ncbi:MAG: PQQ-dependent sugar dehydrogenase, partial [Clostridiales bacterium]|nr:PQQ-dependent sugar dehydrogenase [Clostridiales bacterium]